VLAKRLLPEAAVSTINRYRTRHSYYRYRRKLVTQRFGDYDLTIELIDLVCPRLDIAA
jgi:hypothetical protein